MTKKDVRNYLVKINEVLVLDPDSFLEYYVKHINTGTISTDWISLFEARDRYVLMYVREMLRVL